MRWLPATLLALIAAALPAAPAQALPLGTQAQLSTTTVVPGEGTPGDASAAYDPNLDRFLVVWSSAQENADTVALWGRFVSADGAPLAKPFKVLNAGTKVDDGFDAFNARITYSQVLKKYFVAYIGNATATNREVRGQWLAPTGAKSGAQLTVSDNTDGPNLPQVAPNDAKSGVTVVWHGKVAGTDPVELFAATVGASKVLKRAQLTPSAAGAQYTQPTITVNDRDSQFAIATSLKTASQTIAETVVFRINLDLVAVGGKVRPLPTGTNDARRASIAWNAARDEYAVAWPRVTDGHGELWAARYSATLALLDPPRQVSSAAPPGTTQYGILGESAVSASPISDQWLTLWAGDVATAPTKDDLFEVWGRTVRGDLTDNDPPRQLSAMAPGATPTNGLLTGAVAYDSTHDRWLVPWSGSPAKTLQIFSRIYEPVRPVPVAPPPVVDPCPGAQTYASKAGTTCGPGPVDRFGVGLAARGGRILRVYVTPTARGDRIQVLCRSRCGRHARRASRHGRSKGTWITVTRAGLRKNGTVEVRVSHAGRTTRYRQYTVLAHRPYLKASAGGCRVTTKQLAADC